MIARGDICATCVCGSKSLSNYMMGNSVCNFSEMLCLRSGRDLRRGRDVKVRRVVLVGFEVRHVFGGVVES
jgi:hypothetical protein